MSFWGGGGADKFNLDYISNASGTAYFWNHVVGTDTIVFDASAADTTNLRFGYGVSAAGHFTLNAAYTTAFSATSITDNFLIAGANNVATAAFSGTGVTLDFSDGTSLIFSANNAFTGAFAAAYGNLVTAGGGADVDNTLIFGVASSTIPSFS